MAKIKVPNKFSRKLHMAGLKLKKHSPEILIVAGVVGTVASAVMACKATTKLSGILEETKETVDQIHECANSPAYAEQYTEQDAKKDLTIVYAQTGLKIAKLYAPSVILGALSLTSIIASHNIIRKRNVALAAAYTAVDKGFKEYRSNVVERFGKELDRELRYNIKAKEVEEKVVDENGNEQIVTTTVSVPTIRQFSEYARCFDETCAGWERDSEYNYTFLVHQQNYANQKLQEQGYLYLNDVYKMLGMQATKAGQIVGWIYDEKHPVGDNYVDFGIYDLSDTNKRKFVNGYEKAIWLDFNVDGPILDLMP